MCFKYFMLSNILWYEVLKVCRTPGKKNMNWLFKIYFSCRVYFLVSQLLKLLFPLHYYVLTCRASYVRARSQPRVRAREPRFRICRSSSRWRSPDENNSVDKLFRVACLEIRLHQDCSQLRLRRGAFLSFVMKRKQEKLQYRIRMMTESYKMVNAKSISRANL